MPKIGNPAARVSANRVQKVVATARKLDISEPNHIHSEFQPEALAISAIMRRFGMSFHHAQVVCQLSGLGGQHA